MDDNIQTKLTRHKRSRKTKRFSWSIGNRLTILNVTLIIVIAALLLHVDEAFWPGALNAQRNLIVAGLLLILLVTWLVSPLLVEVDEHPRHLSGPGKNPYIDN